MPTPRATTTRLADVDLPVPASALQPAFGVVPAIVEPAFGPDWRGVEMTVGSTTYRPRLRPEEPVIGVEGNGVARAYPLGVLERHEVVNDAFPRAGERPGDTPLLVTYCPSCGSSMTAVRRVGGEAATFTVSHRLWRSNLVLRDAATGSLWSQLLATAIRGPATGERLALVPSTLESWASWRAAHPDTEVLLPPPLSATQHDIHEPTYGYDRYEASAAIIGEDPGGPGADAGRTLVVGVTADDEATAYPFETVAAAGVVNDVVGGRPVAVAVAPGGTLVAYDRRVGDETLRFRGVDETRLVAGGSRWLVGRGVAVDGPYEGTVLRRANDVPPLFRFAWEAFHPDTEVYGEPD